MTQATSLLRCNIKLQARTPQQSPPRGLSSLPPHIGMQCGHAMQCTSQCDCISMNLELKYNCNSCMHRNMIPAVPNSYIAWQGVHNNTSVVSRRTSMPKAKKHLMPIENRRPARPMMAKASASKSQCDGLCLLACAFSKKPYKQAIHTDHFCNVQYMNCVGKYMLGTLTIATLCNAMFACISLCRS